jgi:hypothetical protein
MDLGLDVRAAFEAAIGSAICEWRAAMPGEAAVLGGLSRDGRRDLGSCRRLSEVRAIARAVPSGAPSG